MLYNNQATLTTANPNLDGTGATVSLLDRTALPAAIVDIIIVKAKVTTTAGMIRLFLKNGSSYFYLYGLAVPVVTLSSTQPGFYAEIRIPNLYIAPNTELRASTEKSEAFDVLIGYREE